MQIFISHSWDNKALIRSLFDLPSYITVWIDDSKMPAGTELNDSIRSAIEDSHLFFVVLSSDSITSEWVLKELEWARVCDQKHPDRLFVVPVCAEKTMQACFDKKLLPEVPLQTKKILSSEPFSLLSTSLYIDASDQSEQGVNTARMQILSTIHQWSCDRVKDYEPVGSTHRLFTDKISNDLLQFQDHLYRVKATLGNPISVLAQGSARKYMSEAKKNYNEYTNYFIAELSNIEDVLRWRYKSSLLPFQKITDYINEDIYRGVGYALNDIIESINYYESELKHDTERYEQAEENRKLRVRELSGKLDKMSIMFSFFIDIVKSET